MKKWVVSVLTFLSFEALADDEIIRYFGPESGLNEIYWSQSKEINEENSIVTAYAVNKDRGWHEDTIGIFLVKPDHIVTLDVFPSERRYDFHPIIEELSITELIVSVRSDYGELKRIRYIFNLDSEPALVKRIELDPEGIPDDMP